MECSLFKKIHIPLFIGGDWLTFPTFQATGILHITEGTDPL